MTIRWDGKEGMDLVGLADASGEMEWVQNWRLRMDFLPVDFLRKIH
jgi:hypothetical protein